MRSKINSALGRVAEPSGRMLPYSLLALAICAIQWLLPETFDGWILGIAAILVAFQFAVSLFSAPDEGSGFFREYFGFLARAFGFMGFACVAALGFFAVLSPADQLHSLTGLAYVAIAAFGYLAARDPYGPSRTFARLPLDSFGPMAALVATSLFVAAALHRFVFVPAWAEYPLGKSVFLAFVFLILCVALFTDERTVPRQRYLALSHARRARIAALARFGRVSLAVVALSAFAFFTGREILDRWTSPQADIVEIPAPETMLPPAVLDPDTARDVMALIAEYGDSGSASAMKPENSEDSVFLDSATGSLSSSGAVRSTDVSSASLAESSEDRTAAPAAPVPEPSSVPKTMRDSFPFTRYVGLGNTGRDVEWIQRLLVRTGFLADSDSGVFDEATSAAFARYMRDRTGDSRGVYSQLGPKTMARFLALPLE